MVMDPDDGDDVEVIYEGKRSPEATEAIDVPETSGLREAEDGKTDVDLALALVADVDDEQKPVLSKQQQEEAAKMAEHRKRFDNQRYQRGQSGSGETGPGAAPVPVPAIPAAKQENKAAHEIMGMNASVSPRKAGLEECLPGGILEDGLGQSAVPVREQRNNHFDDDDEMLMKEILDSIDG
ncbi:unnamed protein product [Symbiodinium pilosum]|uniref:Uncharacterized protein n=1 Tax=Symbiodinium pilosum TaxID=2952 RepID=A0A812UDH3_SYMPI|nr:unnamed protein product [Symbiodinium pilosum]